MKHLMHALMVVMMFSLTACGNKGGLKSPTQIETQRAKEERKKAKEAKEKAEQEQEKAGENAQQ